MPLLSKLYVGSTEVTRAYLGSTLVFGDEDDPGPGPGGPPAVKAVAINSTSSDTIAKPAGAATGDLLLIWFFRDSTNTDNLNNFGISGFTEVREFADWFNQSWGLYYRVLDGSEGSSFTLTGQGSPTIGGGGRMLTVLVEGANASSPIAGFESDTSGSFGSDPVAIPSASPGGADRLGLLFMGGFAFSITNWTVPSGWTVLDDNDGSTSIAVAQADAPVSSATGTLTVSTGDGNTKGCGLVVLIAP